MATAHRALAGATIAAALLSPVATAAPAVATDCVAQAATTTAAGAKFDAAMSRYLTLLGQSQDARGRLQRARTHHRTAETIARLHRAAVSAQHAARDARHLAYAAGAAFKAEQVRNDHCQTAADPNATSTSPKPASSASLDQLLSLLSNSGGALAGYGTAATSGLPTPASTQAQENQLVTLFNTVLQGQAASAGIPGPTYIVPLLFGH